MPFLIQGDLVIKVLLWLLRLNLRNSITLSAEVNKHPGVSHNYERSHEFNMWFTLAVPPYADIKMDLERMASIDGVMKYRVLPTLKLYKIGVRLDMVNEDAKMPEPTDKVKTLMMELESPPNETKNLSVNCRRI